MSANRRRNIAISGEDRLKLITGEIKEIPEPAPAPQEAAPAPQQPAAQQPLAPAARGSLRLWGFVFLALFITSVLAHIAGYSLIPSPFLEGFFSCLLLVAAVFLFAVGRLLSLLTPPQLH